MAEINPIPTNITGKQRGRHGQCAQAKKDGCEAEWNIWRLMVERCHNPAVRQYQDYGGRGVSVCERWRGPNGFANFLADMGRRPDPKLTLERKSNDKGYSPDNCTWATRIAQCRNKRNNRLITFNGETLCLSEWAERIGLRTEALWLRLRRMPLEKALTTPKAKRFT